MTRVHGDREMGHASFAVLCCQQRTSMTRVHGDGERDGLCLLCSVVLSAKDFNDKGAW